MYFALAPESAVLSDQNAELIKAFHAVRNDPGGCIAALEKMPVEKEFYLRTRRSMPICDTGRAIRFMYLMAHGFRGIYQTNKKGEYNTPFCTQFGKKFPNSHEIIAASDVLNSGSLEIHNCDFSGPIQNSGPGDFIFCDPPYEPLPGAIQNKYTASRFKFDHQRRLVEDVEAAHKRGATAIIFNSDLPETRDLYKAAYGVKINRSYSVGKRDKITGELMAVYDSDGPAKWVRAIAGMGLDFEVFGA